jgi:hypothetical protein
VGDPLLVATVTRFSTNIWVGHRTPRYGDVTFQATSFPECKKQVQLCVSQNLREERVQEPGRPLIVYLRLPGTA